MPSQFCGRGDSSIYYHVGGNDEINTSIWKFFITWYYKRI
jgi:hypothetical protein